MCTEVASRDGDPRVLVAAMKAVAEERKRFGLIGAAEEELYGAALEGWERSKWPRQVERNREGPRGRSVSEEVTSRYGDPRFLHLAIKMLAEEGKRLEANRRCDGEKGAAPRRKERTPRRKGRSAQLGVRSGVAGGSGIWGSVLRVAVGWGRGVRVGEEQSGDAGPCPCPDARGTAPRRWIGT